MPNRIYLLIAISFLVGAPILVSIISDALPPAEQAPVTSTHEAEPVEAEPLATEPEMISPVVTELPPGTTDPAFDAAPSMDPQGLALTAPGDQSPPPLSAGDPGEAVVETDEPMEPTLLPPDIPASQHH